MINMWFISSYTKKIKLLKNDIKDSFDSIKNDFNKVSEWLHHLNSKYSHHQGEINELKNTLYVIKNDIIEIKDFISVFNPKLSTDMFKHNQSSTIKQTQSTYIQTPVQSRVQTDILSNLTIMERGIIWTLLNSDMKLSYEDISTLLGKNKSTIRGQINTIKQKNNNLIMESRELNGKKRLYISKEIKKNILKKVKININPLNIEK